MNSMDINSLAFAKAEPYLNKLIINYLIYCSQFIFTVLR